MHAPSYLDAVKEAGSTGRPDPLHGLGTMDNPVFADMHEASALVAGGTLAAARAVLEQTHDHAVNVAGGLHHAMPADASGFCIYNDPAIVIAWLLEHGVEKIAYVDIDAHHGDGVQAAFWTTRGCSPSRCTSPARRCSRALAFRTRSAERAPKGPR